MDVCFLSNLVCFLPHYIYIYLLKGLLFPTSLTSLLTRPYRSPLVTQNNASIESVSLWGNSIRDAAVTSICRALEANQCVKVLSLNNNEMSDKSMPSIADLLRNTRSLTKLDLSGNNNIGDEGASLLAEALQENSTLEDLNLSSNSIRNEGAENFARSLGQTSGSCLKKLDLNSNMISDEGIMSLLVATSNGKTSLSTLIVYGNMFNTSTAAAVVESQKNEPSGGVCIIHKEPELDF